MFESVLGTQDKVSLYPFYYNTFFEILAYIVAITIAISCVYLCAFFIKKLIRLLKNK